MWLPTYCVSWLQERYYPSESSEIPARSIYEKFQKDGGILKSSVIGKYIASVFSGVHLIKRFNSVSSKEELFYTGLAENKSSQMLSCNFDIIKQWIPSPFFVSYDSKEEIHVSMICNTSINGNKIIKNVVFKNNNTWELYISEHKIDLKECSIQNTFIADRQCIANVCSIAYKVRLCNGKQKENTDDISLNSHLIEYLNSDQTKIFRSKSCKRAIPFLCQTCKNCNRFKRKSTPNLDSNKLIKAKVTENIQQSATGTKPLTEIPKANDMNESDGTNNNPKTPISNKFSDNYKSCITNSDSVILQENDNNNMKTIIENVLPEAPPQMTDMLVEQKQNLQRNPYSRRWDKKTIRLCLSLWCRSRKNYEILKESKVLMLPSKETLRIYKNSVDQKAGFNHEVFKWMAEAAKNYRSNDDGMNGGIAIDEMSIQEDLCMVHSNGEVKLVGFVDMGEESASLERLCSGNDEKKLATHVLQFLYMGLNGFRFPFACFPVTQTKAGNLHFLFWRAIQYLNMYGFKVNFVSMDGAQTNRDFMKMFFKDSTPLSEKFSTPNIWFPSHPHIIFIMDYSHVIKRVRNNILKSGEGKNYVRKLHHHTSIIWDHWINAFKWDRDTNSFPIHRKLTNDHLYLNQESKMRNKLAEDVLDGEMLHLMLCFQKSLGDTGDALEDTINLLTATNKIVAVFRDSRPITDTEDIRLEHLQEALNWFQNWENDVLSLEGVPSATKEKQLLSYQTREDIQSCIVGFTQLCKGNLKNDRNSIVPARINSDVIENVFCQQRGIINGNNTNPSFYQFVKNINTVILSQSAISKRSNTGQGTFTPVSFFDNKSRISKTNVRKPLAQLNRL